jgi:hypothetical protein
MIVDGEYAVYVIRYGHDGVVGWRGFRRGLNAHVSIDLRM